MRLGDLFEWAAAGCLTAAAYLASGLPLALVAAGLSFAWFAQLYDVEFHRPASQRRRRLGAFPIPSGRPETVFHCAVCGSDSLASETHVCVP